MTGLNPEAAQVLRELNTWWRDPPVVRPEPPAYRRRAIIDLATRLSKPRSLIEVVRGPRQVGKTTGIHQIIQDLLRAGTAGVEILFVRFDLELLREEPAGLRRILRWYAEKIRKRDLAEGPGAFVFLDEVHKLPRWSEEVKHIGDTFPVRLLLTGSSSVLVARGGRESLAGRVFTTELPPFSFREVVECWHPKLAKPLPKPLRFIDSFDGALVRMNEDLNRLKPQQRLALSRVLERYYNRGGYPRLHSGEVDDDQWADYLSQTIFENVLGADIPDLFPVANPSLLRHVYLAVARGTGREIAQFKLAQDLTAAGLAANQPTVGRYLHYLGDALLVREFRRYPLSKRASARVPAKLTVTDLGVRNAVFRATPSLWESDPAELGPLVETLVQGSIRDANLQVHFFRDYENPKDRRSPIREVDFVAERLDGKVLPLEVKFRGKIAPDDLAGLRFFRSKFDCADPILITRETSGWELDRVLHIPLQNFLLAF